MCKILPRLKDLAEHEGITIGALERSIGASKGVLSRAISNGTDIQSKWLQAIVEKYPQYSAQWLLTGEGEMVIKNTSHLHTKEVNSVLTKNLDNVHHSILEEAGSAGLQRKNKSRSKTFDRIFASADTPEAIPLVSVQAVGGFAGKDFCINEYDIEGYYVIPKFRHLDVDFLIEVIGDSMMPRFFPGDIIACSIINNPRFIQWNKPYLIATREDGMIVKRLRRSSEPDSLLAVSDNEDYEPFDIPKSEIDGLARVVGVIHTE